MSTHQSGVPHESAQEHTIIDYLRAHPEFFVTHTGLLADIQVPHDTNGAISLIERQVNVLREQNLELKRQIQALVQVARDNDRLNDRVQRLTLALFAAPDLAATLRTLGEILRSDFRADVVAAGLFAPAYQLPVLDGAAPLMLRALDRQDEGAAAFATLLASGKPLCGHLRRTQADYLFGATGDQIASAVVLAVTASDDNTQEPRRLGLFGIGSYDAKRYHAGMGTLFLGYLGDLIGRALGRYLPRH